jgi:pimeloyl-ACP methyl ester carboxylesterase
MNAFYMLEQIPVLVSDTKTDKMPLELLHGYLETHEYGILSELLDPDYRTIAPDLPGHGMSGTFIVNDMEKQADVVYAYLKKEKIKENPACRTFHGRICCSGILYEISHMVKKTYTNAFIALPGQPGKKAARDRTLN